MITNEQRLVLEARIAELEALGAIILMPEMQQAKRIADLEAELAKRPPLYEDTRANVSVAVARRRGQFIGEQDERIAELTRIIASLRAEIAQLKMR